MSHYSMRYRQNLGICLNYPRDRIKQNSAKMIQAELAFCLLPFLLKATSVIMLWRVLIYLHRLLVPPLWETQSSTA